MPPPASDLDAKDPIHVNQIQLIPPKQVAPPLPPSPKALADKAADLIRRRDLFVPDPVKSLQLRNGLL